MGGRGHHGGFEMGLLSFLGFGEGDNLDTIDDASVERLESLSEQAVEAVLVPEESIPIEEDAWTLAPSPARARVGASGLEPVQVEAKQSLTPATIDTKAIEQRLDDRFDRIEATMSIMDARLTQLHSTDSLPHTLPTDTLITADREEGEEGDENPPSEEVDQSDESSAPTETVSLLDLYEGRVADLNPFLNRRPDALSNGPTVTVSEISALLLDHLSAPSATAFIEKAKSSGMITKDESAELLAIIGLANPAVNDDGSEHLPHRTLLMFGSMVDAWRTSQATSGVGA